MYDCVCVCVCVLKVQLLEVSSHTIKGASANLSLMRLLAASTRLNNLAKLFNSDESKRTQDDMLQKRSQLIADVEKCAQDFKEFASTFK